MREKQILGGWCWDWETTAYYVGTDGTEGVGSTHIEMRAIQSQQNLDVIEAISLGRKEQEFTRNECYENKTGIVIFSHLYSSPNIQ